MAILLCSQTWGQAATPLLLPSGLAFDTLGNLYFSDATQNVVRKLSPAGVLTVVAGTGTEGFSGDGGPATAARLDAPGALAVDAAGDVFVADTHNHRIRRIDATTAVLTTVVGTGSGGLGADGLAASATPIDLPSALAFDAAGNFYFADSRRHVVRKIDHATGAVTTVAGNGVQGATGDGGAARGASLDSPAGLAVDAAGNLFISDSHNQRVRRVDAGSGIITTVAGTGLPGYTTGPAGASALRLPRGLALDAAGNLYLVDAGNNRLRRIDAATGQIATVAGNGTEGFAGDGAPAGQAELDGPRAVVLSAAGLPTLADTENSRVRQVDAMGDIHTIAGAGAVTTAQGGLLLSGPASTVYGTGSVAATVSGAPAVGSVVFREGTAVLGTSALSANVASLSTSALAAGAHTLTASFAGDSTHGALTSNALPLLVTAAPLLATPNPVSTVYGVPAASLTGTLTGLLPQDVGAVQVTFASAALPLSPVGSYPITAGITGPASASYALATAAAAVTIGKAASSLTLSSGLLAQVTTTTAGQPGGKVTLLDGNTGIATLTADATGSAQFSTAGLSNGSHTLSVSYAGDGNFLPSVSAPVVIMTGPAAGGDFNLASAGAAALTVAAGNSATFSFTESPINGGPPSQIVLSASGLPAGATAVFNPAYLPAGAGAVNFTLTVQTIKAGLVGPGTLVFAGFLLLLLHRRRRVTCSAVAVLALAGCGDRVAGVGQSGQAQTYNIVVNATATSASGATLLHSVTVTLTTQ